jgi:ABC-type glycerol-3-phosphate transport system permease component
MRPSRRTRTVLRQVGIYAAVLAFTAFALFPFLWMIASSVKPPGEIYTMPPRWIIDNPTLQHYLRVLRGSNMPLYFWNTMIVAGGTTLVALAFAISAGYGFARFQFRGKEFWSFFVLISQMLPQAVLLIPLYLFLDRMALINTAHGLGLSYLVITLPLSVWLLRGYFAGIPHELEEAAMIDGCSRLGALFRVIMPIAAPAIIATGIYIFTVAWQEFMFAMNFAATTRTKTISIGIVEFMGEHVVDWGGVMAASVVVTLPVLVIFFAVHKHFVRGITEGSVTG